MLIRKIISVLFAILISSWVYSQRNCQDKIDQANKLYEDGFYKDARSLIENTLDSCELDKNQEGDLIKLLASVYYELDEIELGDEWVAKFVKKNPDYIPNKKNDEYQFQRAYKKIVKWPRFSAGIRAGAPWGFVSTKKFYPVLDKADYTQEFVMQPKIMGGLEFAWNITNYLAIKTGGGIRYQTIVHQVPEYDNRLFFNYSENILNASIPLDIQFTIPIGNSFAAALFVGGEVNYYLGGNYSYNYTSDGSISNEFRQLIDRKADNVKISSDQRNIYRYAAFGGVRFIYKIKNFSLFADVRYSNELDLFNDPETRYYDQDLFLNNNYTMADIELEHLDISVGLLFNFSYVVKSKY